MEPYESRRRALLDRLERGVALFRSPPTTTRNGDVEHEYRQDTDLYYLTGLDEPDCALILSNVHPDHRSILFVRPRNPEREMWEGTRVGVDEAPARLGVSTAYSIDDLPAKLPEFLQNAQKLVTRVGKNARHDAQLFGALDSLRNRARSGVSWPTEIVDPVVITEEMRLIKSPDEIELLRQAVGITSEGFAQAMRQARAGMREYELEATLTHAYRSGGARRHAFLPIVASGPNATVLHYVRNDRLIEQGDLILIDSGCEHAYYAADVTRSFPASGRFSGEQKRIYEIVLAAELAVIERIRPGITFDELHTTACEVIVSGLLDCGLLAGSRSEIIETQSHKRFFPHRIGHWLGMDVHDGGLYFVGGKPRPLAAGMVITVEPGIYVAPTGDHAPKEVRGIGVRIEDDVLVTETGCEVLTRAIPKAIADVEAACRA